jgi:SAM-dependent methyltransferase
MAVPAVADYDARWGYRHFDAERYERRRYGGVKGAVNRWLLERALRRALAGLPRGARLLDVPCGTGVIGEGLARRGFRVIGGDISPAMLTVAHRKAYGDGAVRADLERLPIRDRSVDAVVCIRFLMHLPAAARPAVLAELARTSRGPVVGTFCHPYTVKTFQRWVRRLLGGRAKRSPRIDRRALAAEAAAAGLRVRRVIPAMPLLSEVWVVVLDSVA